MSNEMVSNMRILSSSKMFSLLSLRLLYWCNRIFFINTNKRCFFSRLKTFDHHCPWLNNCVGKINEKENLFSIFVKLTGRRNYHYFINFLLSVLVHMFIVLSLCIYYTFKNRSNLGNVSSIISIVLMVLIILLTIPIGGLTTFHIMLITRGRTTNEQVTGKFKSNINPVKILSKKSLLLHLSNIHLVWLWMFIQLLKNICIIKTSKVLSLDLHLCRALIDFCLDCWLQRNKFREENRKVIKSKEKKKRISMEKIQIK